MKHEKPVLPLPVDWVRQMDPEPTYVSEVSVLYQEGFPRGLTEHRFLGHVRFEPELACWCVLVALNGVPIYSSEHRERDEACGAAVVAMQRAIDVRYP